MGYVITKLILIPVDILVYVQSSLKQDITLHDLATCKLKYKVCPLHSQYIGGIETE